MQKPVLTDHSRRRPTAACHQVSFSGNILNCIVLNYICFNLVSLKKTVVVKFNNAVRFDEPCINCSSFIIGYIVYAKQMNRWRKFKLTYFYWSSLRS